VEVLANSDNVLRAGLTPKHMDVPELLANLDYGRSGPVRPRQVRSGCVHEFAVPVPDFRVALIALAGPVEVDWPGPRIAWTLAGTAFAATGGHTRRVETGQAVFLGGTEGRVRFHGEGRVLLVAPGM
jgi:mannose-6-phosphate isomerase